MQLIQFGWRQGKGPRVIGQLDASVPGAYSASVSGTTAVGRSAERVGSPLRGWLNSAPGGKSAFCESMWLFG